LLVSKKINIFLEKKIINKKKTNIWVDFIW